MGVSFVRQGFGMFNRQVRCRSQTLPETDKRPRDFWRGMLKSVSDDITPPLWTWSQMFCCLSGHGSEKIRELVTFSAQQRPVNWNAGSATFDVNHLTSCLSKRIFNLVPGGIFPVQARYGWLSDLHKPAPRARESSFFISWIRRNRINLPTW